jgi:hypothetical protein
MESEDSLPCREEPATGLCPQPDESNSQPTCIQQSQMAKRRDRHWTLPATRWIQQSAYLYTAVTDGQEKRPPLDSARKQMNPTVRLPVYSGHRWPREETATELCPQLDESNSQPTCIQRSQMAKRRARHWTLPATRWIQQSAYLYTAVTDGQEKSPPLNSVRNQMNPTVSLPCIKPRFLSHLAYCLFAVLTDLFRLLGPMWWRVNISVLSGNRSLVVQPVASHFTDWATTVPLTGLIR